MHSEEYVPQIRPAIIGIANVIIEVTPHIAHTTQIASTAKAVVTVVFTERVID